MDGEDGLAAALSLLPKLQYLSLKLNYGIEYEECSHECPVLMSCPGSVLQGLHQLTYLKLALLDLGESDGHHAVQHLQGLTGLRDLLLSALNLAQTHNIEASVLSGMSQLTCSKLTGCKPHGCILFAPGALAHKTQLQHLEAQACKIAGGSEGIGSLLCQLQQQQQLTRLSLRYTLEDDVSLVPAAAYSALTASSKLQHLDISHNKLPASVWEHVFPTGGLLPHLLVLHISDVQHPSGFAAAPEGSRLVSCCPGLQSLHKERLLYNGGLLDPLSRLSGLHKLAVRPTAEHLGWEGLDVLYQLTTLRRLDIAGCWKEDDVLLQLTQLKHLTCLRLD